MARTAGRAVLRMEELLRESQGLNLSLARAASEAGSIAPLIGDAQIVRQAVAQEVLEKATVVAYPVVMVSCTSMKNSLREKFRVFAGTIGLSIEVRASSDRLEAVTEELMVSVEAVSDLLQRRRGNWGEGLYHSGTYEVEFLPVKRGGKGFLQCARVSLGVECRID